MAPTPPDSSLVTAIADRAARVRDQIAEAATRAGREPAVDTLDPACSHPGVEDSLVVELSTRGGFAVEPPVRIGVGVRRAGLA